MIKPIRYGLLCEDMPQRHFLDAYLNLCFTGRFEKDEDFGWQIHTTTAKEVENTLPDALRKGFTKFKLGTLFVGRDADSGDRKKVDSLISKLAGICQSYPQAILVVPVQCIEHWLWYLKWRQDNHLSTKNVSFEQFDRRDAKRAVYGGSIKIDKQLEEVSKLVQSLDVYWLESRSESFKHFHQQVVTFLNNHKTTQA
ncbi:hypothetical protein ACO2Q8_02715 [Larkinella sp. VNQ87]|uniref:hypothetical protein n=1 Tax=Larkinella sp. VNQ87 TaxID=3400921 RepID=UPI003C014350